MSARPQAVAAMLIEATALKALPRAGWVRQSVPAPESVAAHSHGVALLAAVLCPPHLDRLTLIEIALAHDLPEVRAGDITPHDGIARAEKLRREAEAADVMLAATPHLLDRWRAYAEGTSAEARFAHELDKLDMGLQAIAYRRAHPETDVAELLASADRGICEPALREIWEAALQLNPEASAAGGPR